MKILLHNRQKYLRVRTAEIKTLVGFFLAKASRIDPGLRGQIGVVLMNDKGMRNFNRRFFNLDTPTDVFSFRYNPPPGIPEIIVGECFVNAQMALRLGPRHGGTARELALYLAHACDHLTGADDATDHQRRSMRRRELRWLKEARHKRLLHEGLIA